MVQQLDSPPDTPTDHDAGLHPAQLPVQLLVEPTARPAGQSAGRPVRVRQPRPEKPAVPQVVVVDGVGSLGEVVEDLDRAIQLALAEGPRGVVCDLSRVVGGVEPVALELLATSGRHARDWPGIPVAIACPDPRVREALVAHPLGAYLIVTDSLSCAVSALQETPTLTAVGRQLAPHPTAPRASREFVTRTLLDWRLGRVIPFASLVVGELVASSTVHAGTRIDLSVVWDRGALRLTVRDRGPALAGQRPSALELRGRGLTVVAGISRSFGVLPTADGGKVVWAVLDAPRPRSVSTEFRSEGASSAVEPPEFIDGRGTAELPFCAGAGRLPD